MANTKPLVDNEETLRYVLEEGKKTGIHTITNIRKELILQILPIC